MLVGPLREMVSGALAYTPPHPTPHIHFPIIMGFFGINFDHLKGCIRYYLS